MNTTINNRYDLLDALETETYTARSFDVVPENGEQTVTLMTSEPGSKYPFKCNLYNPRRNDSRRVYDERKGEYVNTLYDDSQAPDAIIRPAAIQLFFQRADGGVFSAYLANYIDKHGIPAWNKFVDTISDQTKGDTLGMNITQVLAYLTKHPFRVYVYNNPKYKDKQVCYTERDYLYWQGIELERQRKEQAAVKRAEQKRQRKAKAEIEASVELSKEQA